MLLTIATTANPATDLGWLLHKNPGNIQQFDQSFGTAWVFYPEADEDRCTAALMLEVDTARLARAFGRTGPGFSLSQYVNDRPYAASSLLAVALGKVFSTARTGRCDARPELAAAPLPLHIELPAVPCRGGPELARELFASLGWEVDATAIPLPGFDQSSRYVNLRLSGTVRLADALNQLYVLLPVLDDAKHYWVDIGEIDKLLRSGGEWLAAHPKRELITKRYLAHQRSFERAAFARLAEAGDATEEALETPIEEEPAIPGASEPLYRRRIAAVLEALRATGAASVLDLGCGSGKLVSELLQDHRFARIVGADVSPRALQQAEKALKLDRLPEHQARRLELIQGSAVYRDRRFENFDAAVLMEVIEHVDPGRLPALEGVVFAAAKPRTVIVTTPNVEYNVRYGMDGHHLRHADHRFEWDRARFTEWATRTAAQHGYLVRIVGVGEADPEVGAPTQMGVFERA